MSYIKVKVLTLPQEPMQGAKDQCSRGGIQLPLCSSAARDTLGRREYAWLELQETNRKIRLVMESNHHPC